MIKVAIAGLGKMGLSHLAILNAHPDVELRAVCDTSSYVLGVLHKYTGVTTYDDYDRMLREVDLDAVVIATPSRMHSRMVRAALERGLNVFCEKPFTIDPANAAALTALSTERGVVSQVGYHNKFVGAFREMKRLLDAGAIGTVTHVSGEAYGPVVLKPKGGTWRSRPEEGGGSLYDYAAHPIDLLNWYLGEPVGAGGTVLGKIFSRDTDDEVYGTLFYEGGTSARISVNWSDESYRKMTTRITATGTAGRIYADRQEVQVFLRDSAPIPDGYEPGWNVRYTTELTDPVAFYLRGEEYTAQVDHFVERVQAGRTEGLNSFESAAKTDRVIAMMIEDAHKGASTRAGEHQVRAVQPRRRWLRLPRLAPQRPQTVSPARARGGS